MSRIPWDTRRLGSETVHLRRQDRLRAAVHGIHQGRPSWPRVATRNNQAVTVRLKGRRRAVRAVLDDVRTWAAERDDVQAVVLVGSYARHAERMGSDVDLMVLTDEPDRVADSEWFEILRPGARLIRAMNWGPVRERRMRLRSGLQVELGIAPISWAAVPLDAGTQRVLSDGHRVNYDAGVLATAVAAL